MSKLRRLLFPAVCAAVCVGPPACDPCEPEPDSGNQDPQSLMECPPLPAGVEPIDGLVTARAHERFDGLVVTLSTRPLACGDPAAQHEYCGDGEGLTMGFPAEATTVGIHSLGSPLHVEFETPDSLSVGGRIEGAVVELFEVTDDCVTGRVVGVADVGGPFDGGFQAPRCTP